MPFARYGAVVVMVGAVLSACSETETGGSTGGVGGSSSDEGGGGQAGAGAKSGGAGGSSASGAGGTSGTSGGAAGASGGSGNGGSGNGGGSGNAGSGTGGSGTGGSGTGGSGGSSNAGTGGTPVDAGALCDVRSQGALIDFDIGGESLTVWITNGAFIDEATTLLASGDQRIPVFEGLLDGRDCDSDWTWHVDPTNVSFADFTIELCDGLPSHIEADKAYWIGTVKSYCPWSAKVTAIDDRR